uniref:NADH-ubiquinone oxidoreductase chain 3 n=1 Tax=Physconelloides eurysema TaxID=135605 RepID=Q2FCB0_9NEOP|nr:NADH dehydrogenase subunit 3 [Physconelloides eurysema]
MKWVEYVLCVIFIVVLLWGVSGMFSLSEKTGANSELYECGIESIQDEKAPFYLHFFLIGILFLLFDVELIVCIPMIWMNLLEKSWGMVWFFFFLILFFGLVLEVLMETVSWKE